MEAVLDTVTSSISKKCVLNMSFFVSISVLWMFSMMATSVSAASWGVFGDVSPSKNIAGHIPLNYLNAQRFFLGSQISHHTLPPHPSPLGSPKPSFQPLGGSSSPQGNPPNRPHPFGPHKRHTFDDPSPLPTGVKSSNRLNSGQITGLVLLSIAGLLQAVVVTYLLVKRKQMLRVVEKYEV